MTPDSHQQPLRRPTNIAATDASNICRPTMNTRPVLDPVKQPFALAVAFNADNSFFSVAHEAGFKGRLDSLREGAC